MKAVLYKPKASMSYSENTVDPGIVTYNQSGLTYNESGYTYGGVDRNSAEPPLNKLAKIYKPNNNTTYIIKPN